MSLLTYKRRVVRMETHWGPRDENSFTFEELCRALWNRDPEEFRRTAAERGGLLAVMVPRLEGSASRDGRQVGARREARCGN
jgi:hypothetical protein